MKKVKRTVEGQEAPAEGATNGQEAAPPIIQPMLASADLAMKLPGERTRLVNDHARLLTEENQLEARLVQIRQARLRIEGAIEMCDLLAGNGNRAQPRMRQVSPAPETEARVKLTPGAQ